MLLISPGLIQFIQQKEVSLLDGLIGRKSGSGLYLQGLIHTGR